jgi:hypothetical protein
MFIYNSQRMVQAGNGMPRNRSYGGIGSIFRQKSQFELEKQLIDHRADASIRVNTANAEARGEQDRKKAVIGAATGAWGKAQETTELGKRARRQRNHLKALNRATNNTAEKIEDKDNPGSFIPNPDKWSGEVVDASVGEAKGIFQRKGAPGAAPDEPAEDFENKSKIDKGDNIKP